MKEVDTKDVVVTPYDNLQFATEVAWGSLVDRAIKDGLLPAGDKPNGLMYMPSQSVTQQFRNACKAILVDLGAKLDE